MILMSQNSLLDESHDAQLDEWYLEHLRNMSSVPGIFSAQRFKTASAGFPRTVALYSVVSEKAFDHPYYQRIRGFGVLTPYINECDHHVDLFDGLDEAPFAGESERLLLTNRKAPAGAIAGIPFIWLKCVARSFSTPYRGIAVVAADAVPGLDASVAVYRPVTVRYGAVAGNKQ
jgi:hypothetical protein